MKKSERCSLSCFLSDYPSDMSYEDILDLLSKGETEDENGNEINIWEPFENMDPSYVAEQIDNHKEAIEAEYNSEESKKEKAIAIKRVLVDLAIEDKLPMDMNLLDYTIFYDCLKN